VTTRFVRSSTGTIESCIASGPITSRS
jgi:hypothetical protein